MNSKADLSLETVIGIIIAVTALLVLLYVYDLIKGAVEVLPG